MFRQSMQNFAMTNFFFYSDPVYIYRESSEAEG